MMNIGCVYSVGDFATVDQPLANSGQIPFGLSIIATILNESNHNVNLFVICSKTSLESTLGDYIKTQQPKLFCLSAVSSQFTQIECIAKFIKKTNPDIFVILGGHHASLASDSAISPPYFDAICVGEGDVAVKELASQIKANVMKVSNIPNLWIKDKSTGFVEKNGTLPYNQNLEQLPFIDRTLWDQWVVNKSEELSILIGRGCPFKCTYCSNHAMRTLAKGNYVRFRDPEDLIGEIKYVCSQYPQLSYIYLEVETIGANIITALDLFSALAKYNNQRDNKLSFGINLALHSNFVTKQDRVEKFFDYCKKANVIKLNIGLESGSEKLRKEVLSRPRYTNQELIEFCIQAKKREIAISLFVLVGLPDETPKLFAETAKVVRQIQPDNILLSIFYPYIGTDLYNLAIERGYISGMEYLNTSTERNQSVLNMPNFSSRRILIEYCLFWYRVYKGVWSYPKIFAYVTHSFIASQPSIQRIYRYLINNNSYFSTLKRWVTRNERSYTS